MELFRNFTFESAHSLPNVAQGHKCSRIHGHSYRLLVTVEGDVDPDTGFVIDFGDLKRVVEPVLEQLDHHVLNDVIYNPTCENLIDWLWIRFERPELYELSSVELWETATSGCRRRAVPR